MSSSMTGVVTWREKAVFTGMRHNNEPFFASNPITPSHVKQTACLIPPIIAIIGGANAAMSFWDFQMTFPVIFSKQTTPAPFVPPTHA